MNVGFAPRSTAAPLGGSFGVGRRLRGERVGRPRGCGRRRLVDEFRFERFGLGERGVRPSLDVLVDRADAAEVAAHRLRRGVHLVEALGERLDRRFEFGDPALDGREVLQRREVGVAVGEGSLDRVEPRGEVGSAVGGVVRRDRSAGSGCSGVCVTVSVEVDWVGRHVAAWSRHLI